MKHCKRKIENNDTLNVDFHPFWVAVIFITFHYGTNVTHTNSDKSQQLTIRDDKNGYYFK